MIKTRDILFAILGVIVFISGLFFSYRHFSKKIKEVKINYIINSMEIDLNKNFNSEIKGVDQGYEMVYNENTNTLEVKVHFDFLTKENKEVVNNLIYNPDEGREILRKMAENVNYPFVDYMEELCLENKLKKEDIHLQITHYIGSAKILTTVDKEVLWSIVSL